MKRVTLLVAVLNLVMTIHVGADVSPSRVFILAGQSNMVGAGVTFELRENLKKMPRNVKYHSIVDLQSRGEKTSFSGQQWFGPEVTFAHEMSKAWPKKEIMLIKFAVGGTSLLAWAPEWKPEVAAKTGNRAVGPLYRKLMEYVKKTVGDKKVQFAGVLWMQGERDAAVQTAARDYGKNFKTLILQIRSDLKTPELPVIFGQVNPPPKWYPAHKEVRNAQQKAEKEIPHTKMVSTRGVKKWIDNLHYDTEGQIELGKRFAHAYLEALKMRKETKLQ